MQENQMQDMNQGPGGIAYPSSGGPPGVQYPTSDPQASQTNRELIQPQLVQQQPGMVQQQPGMQQPGMMPQPGQAPGQMQISQDQMRMLNMLPGKMPGIQMQPGQVPGMQMQPGQVPGTSMQQDYEAPDGCMKYFEPNSQIQRDAPASQSNHDFLEQVYVYDVKYFANQLFIAAAVLLMLDFFLVFEQKDQLGSNLLPPVLMIAFCSGICQCVGFWQLFMKPEKITVRFCISQDDVNITKKFKGDRTVKESRKLSDLKDVFVTNKYDTQKNKTGSSQKTLKGHNVHLKWNKGVDSVFFLPLPNDTHYVKAQEINQFVFKGGAKMEENANEFECSTCLKDFCMFFPAAIFMGAVSALIMYGITQNT